MDDALFLFLLIVGSPYSVTRLSAVIFKVVGFLLLHDLHNQIHSINDWILFLSIIFHNSEETAGRFRIKGSKIWWQMQRQDLAKPVNMCRISIISLKGKQKNC